MAWSSATAGGIVALALLLLGLGPVSAVEPGPTDPAAIEFFEARVRPVLAERCLKCHVGEAPKGGLRLDSREAILLGGETGPAAVPGKPGESLLVEAIRYGESVQMPPKSRLAAAEVDALTRWVAMGLPWPAVGKGLAGTARETTAKAAFDLKGRRDEHWAWRPVRSRTPPEVNDRAWPLDPLDRFLLARLESKGMRPAPDADRRAMIRRLTFDLTGLPPTPREVAGFENDTGPDWYERLVERLLASPRFGERWGRHWLDLVRYAETRGHEFDPDIPNAWQYRDYVIRALNADVPYDRFLTEHIAGDLVERPRLDPATGRNESVVGTGFWFLGEEIHSPVDVRQDETDRMDNRLDVMTKTFLGLTVACARCHDHKFDAISQRDYYALSGFLISSSYRQVRFATAGRERHAAERLQAVRDSTRARVLASAARAAAPWIDRVADDLLAARSLPPGGSQDERLSRWAEELRRARSDPENPLHCFATTGKIGTAPPAESPHGGKVVVDFGRLESLTGFQDGNSFGLRPVKPGDLAPATDPSRSPFEVVTRASARRDPVFRRLPLAARTERDHGRLGTWDRAGQTLRTPDFTVGSGRLWYLARGAGRAYAAVNAHLVIAGPLHASLLTEWTDGKAGWRWVRHDLPAYQGHRAHVEFSPSGPGELEIARVVDGPEKPRAVDGPAGGSTHTDRETPETSARAFQARFAEAVRRMEDDSLDGPDDAGGVARLAAWTLRNLDLFGKGECEARDAIRGEAERLRAAEESIAVQVAVESPTAPAMLDGSGVNERLLIRGSSRTPGPEVPRRFLEAIAGDAPLQAGPRGGSGRLELARQMLDPADPFASRVIVNRVWHHLFGRGIVATVDNFGVLGEPPTHPELLDDLAARFVRDGWSIKRLVRALVSSRAYRMTSRPDPAADALDPDNRLLHRMPVRRLEAEPIRDAILAVSGGLDGRMFGPSVPVHLTPYMQGRGRPKASGPVDGDGRRSLYLAIRRNFLSPMMLAFDAPIPFSSVGRRNVSNVPAQALILMNDPFVVRQAGLWADRVLAVPDTTPERRVTLLYRSAFSRPPEPSEIADALDFLDSQGRELGLSADAWKTDRRGGPTSPTSCSIPRNSSSSISRGRDQGARDRMFPCRRIAGHAPSRREMLARCAGGFGAVALAALLAESQAGTSGAATGRRNPLAPRAPHFGARARSVIFLYMDGGPSQVDTFDPKPRLRAEHGRPFAMKMEPTQFNNNGNTLGSPWKFHQYGRSGIPVSGLFPNVARHVDDLAVVRSMVSNFSEHTSANYFLHTGSGLQGRPSMGAWFGYGLGSESADLPGFVVLNGGLIPPGGLDNFNSGFLPASYQGSVFNPGDAPLANVRRVEPTEGLQANKLRYLKRIDAGVLDRIGHLDPLESAVANYELAYRMQAAVPELADITGESLATRRLYGLDARFAPTAIFSRQCLLARRLVERGVRFVELTCPVVGGDRWDQHSDLKSGHENNARAVDQPIAALLTDLKQRGLLDRTLVVWAGEFGRTPFAQGSDGRDHNPFGFSIWLAGGGVKGGTIYGQTDDYGYKVVENKVEVHDLHATMLHLLGIDHQRLTLRFGGRDMRLTDVKGEVVRAILA